MKPQFTRQSQSWFGNHLGLLAMISVLEFGLSAPLAAQTFATLHSFNGEDGRQPQNSRLILSGTTLYGQTSEGVTNGHGNIFRCNIDGTDFRNLYSFTPAPFGTNSDGGGPVGRMVLSGDTLYGVAYGGGDSGNGTVFALNTDGTGFNVLHSFATGTVDIITRVYITNSDGARPWGGLILSNDTLYGTTGLGGSSGVGTVFALNTNGTGFRVLHTFTGDVDGTSPGTLTISGTTLYGTASRGGSSDVGTVFALNTDGTGFTVLHTFTGDDGSWPSGCVLSGSTLYGAAGGGSGATSSGNIFALNVNGTGFVTLHTFAPADASSLPATNADGSGAIEMILSGHILYGTTVTGGTFGSGTVFSINTDGSDFTILYTFTAWGGWVAPGVTTNRDGAIPKNPLMLSGNTLYGMTGYGGAWGCGTVFSISLPGPPQVSLVSSGGNLILSWPSSATGLTLQSTSDLASPVWNTNLPRPVVVNGKNTLTIPMAGTQQFFRLSH